MFNDKPYIPAFWYLSDNFGDSLSYYLAKKISGKPVAWVDMNDECDKAVITGSILNNPIKNAHVWGAGIASSQDTIPQHKKICAVRGYKTAEICEQQKIEFDKVYGDPALLLPKFYNPANYGREINYQLGIIPHYVDLPFVMDKLCRTPHNDEIKIINILDDVEKVIDEILSCKQILSSSLHGLIASHAYGVPAEWTKFSDKIGGNDFKYIDYYTTTSKKGKTDFIDMRNEALSLQAIEKLAETPFTRTDITVDLDALYNACPFKR